MNPLPDLPLLGTSFTTACGKGYERNAGPEFEPT